MTGPAHPGRLVILVTGRPAPQGSKKKGDHGQMREASVYLPAWRAAVKRAVYERYRELGVEPADLPYFRGAVHMTRCALVMPHGHRADGPPDADKLVRAIWDALTLARVWEDDARVVALDGVRKREAAQGESTGAVIEIEQA